MSNDQDNGETGATWKPRPDPTLLTTQQLLRELAGLKEIVFTRLDAMDKAVELFDMNLTRVPTETDKAIEHLKELHEEKFTSVQTQFKERDVRVEQTARDTKVAVDAALQAAEKAVGKQNESFALSIEKSENATIKQIDQQGQLIATTTKALDDKITDVKDRLTRLEGKSEGSGLNMMYIAAITAVIAVIIALLGYLRH
jgi:hypothetical protein